MFLTKATTNISLGALLKSAREIMRKDKGLPIPGSEGVLACGFEHRPGAWFCNCRGALAYEYGQR